MMHDAWCMMYDVSKKPVMESNPIRLLTRFSMTRLVEFRRKRTTQHREKERYVDIMISHHLMYNQNKERYTFLLLQKFACRCQSITNDPPTSYSFWKKYAIVFVSVIFWILFVFVFVFYLWILDMGVMRTKMMRNNFFMMFIFFIPKKSSIYVRIKQYQIDGSRL